MRSKPEIFHLVHNEHMLDHHLHHSKFDNISHDPCPLLLVSPLSDQLLRVDLVTFSWRLAVDPNQTEYDTLDHSCFGN